MPYELVKLSFPLGFSRILQANIASRQQYFQFFTPYM